VLKTGEQGEVHLAPRTWRDRVPRSQDSLWRALLNGQQAVGTAIFQAPGSNSAGLCRRRCARRWAETLQEEFPEGP